MGRGLGNWEKRNGALSESHSSQQQQQTGPQRPGEERALKRRSQGCWGAPIERAWKTSSAKAPAETLLKERALSSPPAHRPMRSSARPCCSRRLVAAAPASVGFWQDEDESIHFCRAVWCVCVCVCMRRLSASRGPLLCKMKKAAAVVSGGRAAAPAPTMYIVHTSSPHGQRPKITSAPAFPPYFVHTPTGIRTRPSTQPQRSAASPHRTLATVQKPARSHCRALALSTASCGAHRLLSQ